MAPSWGDSDPPSDVLDLDLFGGLPAAERRASELPGAAGEPEAGRGGRGGPTDSGGRTPEEGGGRTPEDSEALTTSIPVLLPSEC